MLSSVDCITTTSEFEFSVHTRVQLNTAAKSGHRSWTDHLLTIHVLSDIN